MWAYNSIFYQIYPIGFCGAPVHNDGVCVPRIRKLMDWSEYLQTLGVDSILLNPIFESDNHGYDTRDFRKIDCRLGTNEDFSDVCKDLHDHDIKIVLDGVFNHVGRGFWAFRDVQEKKWDSPYKDWYKGVNFGWQSPLGDPFGYEAWQGHFELPCLNLYNQQVKDYLFDVIRFWVDEFDIDGIRLDCANILDFNFMKEMRAKTASMKPDFWLMGEVIHGDYSRWVNGDTLHSVTNYALHKALYSGHNDHNYFEIAHSLNRQFANGGIYRNIYTYNFVDNHDVNRIASSLKDKNHLNNVYTLMYTMPGVPSIYYGSEYGIEGMRTNHSDYELRPCLDLDSIPNPNYQLFDHIVKLGKIRLALEALKYGDFANVKIMNEKLVYKRWTNNQTVFVAFNLTDHDEWIDFDTGCNAKLTDVLNDNEVIDVNGYYNLYMKPYSARILVVNDGSFKVDFSDNSTVEITKPVENTEATDAQVEEQHFYTEVKPGKYRHFKGNEYEVIGTALHSETGEKLVVYKALYNDGGLWVRPYDMFKEIIEKDGKKIQRFTPID